MATIQCGLLGSAIAPDNTKNYGITDTDLQAIVDWGKVVYNPQIQKRFNPGGNPDFVPTNTQVLVTWFDQWMKGTMDSVQKQGTSVIVPPPIDISGVPE